MEIETAFVNPLIPFIRIFLHLSPEKTIKLFGERLPPQWKRDPDIVCGVLKEGGVKLALFKIPNLMSAVTEEHGQSLSLTSPQNITLPEMGL